MFEKLSLLTNSNLWFGCVFEHRRPVYPVVLYEDVCVWGGGGEEWWSREMEMKQVEGELTSNLQ